MFKKPLAHQSNATPIRSSARRQLLNSIFEQYPSLLAHQQDKDGDGIKKEIGKTILPEGVRVATFETSTGTEGTFWLTPDGTPLWMTFGRNSKEYIPTLYLLSLPLPHPLLEMIQIHSPVPPPILTGAPLFIPAVANISSPHLLPSLQKSQLCAFVTSEARNNQVHYIGVGRLAAEGGMKGAWERRVKHLKDDSDIEEGKFADILCIIGDHLWQLSSQPNPPSFNLHIPRIPLASPPGTTEAKSSISPSPPRVEELYVSASTSSDASPPTISSAPLSPSEVSALLSVSLLQALSAIQPSSFPMPASLLYSSHVLPARPTYIPKEKRDEVVIGKSEWKKLAKWMKEVGKDGLVKIKENKGEITVVSFDPSCPSLQAHDDHTTIAQEETRLAKRAAREAASDSASQSGQSSSHSLVVEETWKPAGAAISFWEAAGLSKSQHYPSSALKQTIDNYIAKNNLIEGTNHRLVVLDEELGRAVGVKKPDPGQTMARDEVINKLRGGVNWAVSIDGVLKKGTLQPITLHTTSRGGRRSITHIVGLELFSIDPATFAEYMRKKCAGSASVGPREGISPKLGLQEVQVQGTQQKAVIEALLERGVPKKYIKDDGKK